MLPAMRLSLQTVADNPDLLEQIQALIGEAWPAYIFQAAAPAGHEQTDWMGIYRRWPGLQFGLFEDGALVAVGNALAMRWSGDPAVLPEEGWDAAMRSAAKDADAGRAADTLCALSISITPENRGRGLSARAIQAMRSLGQAQGLVRMVAPVRPNWKPRYPLAPIEQYIRWETAEGLPLDPWLRTHVRLGGRVCGPCRRSMTLGGSVADWERWLGLPLPETGRYTAPGLLVPLRVDREADTGLYVEPNVWVEHPMPG